MLSGTRVMLMRCILAPTFPKSPPTPCLPAESLRHGSREAGVS